MLFSGFCRIFVHKVRTEKKMCNNFTDIRPAYGYNNKYEFCNIRNRAEAYAFQGCSPEKEQLNFKNISACTILKTYAI